MSIRSILRSFSALLGTVVVLMPALPAAAQEDDLSVLLDEIMVYNRQPRMQALPKTYMYRITFRDKRNNSHSVSRPSTFLSAKALARRERLGVRVDAYDLPVSGVYLDFLRRKGLRVVCTSRWNNTAVVEVADTTLLNDLDRVKFVQDVCRVYVSPDSVKVTEGFADMETPGKDQEREDPYGHAAQQVRQIGADRLHNRGYRGKGITIAVIDGGFNHADSIAALKGTRVVATHNFVSPGRRVYDMEQDHGTMVLSCMAANMPHILVGTAPEADYMLLVSEDGRSEQLVEEDYWCAAIEYADSAGADIISTSLGYTTFDHNPGTHRYDELDGRTHVNSRSASLAASRGLIVLNSAGNSGDEEWKKIGFPADADHILAVGAVDSQGLNTSFSSVGNTADGRIKPDVMAMGSGVAVVDCSGALCRVAGTSFSCPILAGGMACLLEAFSNRSPDDLMQAVRATATNAQRPDNIFGYGIARLDSAFESLTTVTPRTEEE